MTHPSLAALARPTRFAALLALCLTALCLTALPAWAQVAPGTVLDEIVAVIDDAPVLRSDVDGLAYQLARGTPPTDEVWSRALDEIIAERILATHASRDTTIIITEEQVSQQVDARIAQIAEQLGGEAQIATAFGRPVESIRLSLRDEVRRQLLAQQFQSRRLRELRVSPQEVRAFFEAIPAAERPQVPALVRVAHIVLKPAPDPQAEARIRSRAEAIRDSILAGTPIEELARRHSQDPGSTANGGRYDALNLSDLVPEFAAAVGSLQPGALSQVFRTEFGFHVARLNSRQGDRVSFNHVLLGLGTATVDPAPTLAALAALRDSIVTHNVPFEAVARRHSEDPYSATRGGYVSDPRTGERDLQMAGLGPRWQTTLDTLAVGEVSLPGAVDLLDGTPAYHIVLLQRKTAAHPLNLQDDYALLSQYALQEKRQRDRDAWIARLRDSVYIDVRSPRYRPAQG